MTGAPVPEGADAVAMMEHVEQGVGRGVGRGGDGSCGAGENVVPRGSEARLGDVRAGGGDGDGSGGDCAGGGVRARGDWRCGRGRVVAIVATGDELVELDQAPEE